MTDEEVIKFLLEMDLHVKDEIYLRAEEICSEIRSRIEMEMRSHIQEVLGDAQESIQSQITQNGRDLQRELNAMQVQRNTMQDQINRVRNLRNELETTQDRKIGDLQRQFADERNIMQNQINDLQSQADSDRSTMQAQIRQIRALLKNLGRWLGF